MSTASDFTKSYVVDEQLVKNDDVDIELYKSSVYNAGHGHPPSSQGLARSCRADADFFVAVALWVIEMVLVFLCLDWLVPSFFDAPESGHAPVNTGEEQARSARIEKLATCLKGFKGAVGVLATRRMMGRRIYDARPYLGELGLITRYSINTLAESPHEFVSDYLKLRNVEWVAMTSSSVSFPEAQKGRVVEFDEETGDIDSTCTDLAKLLGAFGKVAVTRPTNSEMSRLFPAAHMATALRAHVGGAKESRAHHASTSARP